MGLAGWLREGEPLEAVEHWVRVDGHNVHLFKVGGGAPLVLLHGLVGTAEAWEPTLPTLATASTVYAMDSLGIGRSDRVPWLDPSLVAQAGRVARFMDAVGIQSSDFLTTSHGGAVALMLAACYPGRVKTLILHAPANPFSNLADSAVRFYQSPLGRWFARRIPALSRKTQALAMFHLYGDAEGREGSLETYLESLRVPGTIDYLLKLLAGWFEDMETLEAVLGRVREVPTLLLWGDRDRVMSLESGRRLQRCFARCDFVVLPGVGHLAYEECPRIFTEAVNSFLFRERSQFKPDPSPSPIKDWPVESGRRPFLMR